MLKHSEINNMIRLRQQRHNLQREHEKAAIDKNVHEVDKFNEYMFEKDKKIKHRHEMQKQIENNQKLNKQYEDTNKEEVDHMHKHEFDLLSINEARHNEKIKMLVNRNDKINVLSTKYGQFMSNPITGYSDLNTSSEDTN
jgi:hypothetical protein